MCSRSIPCSGAPTRRSIEGSIVFHLDRQPFPTLMVGHQFHPSEEYPMQHLLDQAKKLIEEGFVIEATGWPELFEAWRHGVAQVSL